MSKSLTISLLFLIFLFKIICEVGINKNNTYISNNLNESIIIPTPLQNDTVNRTECEGKIFINQITVEEEELEIICDTLLQHPMYLLRIQKYSESLISSTVILESLSLKFFNKICINFPSMCNDGILIDLFIEDKIIIIQPGKLSEKIVSDIYRKRVIETVSYNLLNKEWGISLNKLVRLLDHRLKGGATKLNQGQSNDPTIFIYSILAPTLITIFVIVFIFIFLMGKGYLNSGLFYFMDKMLDYWEEINVSPEKRIQLPPNTCLFCMKQGNNTYKFLYCNHSYHYRCLYKWQLDDEKCCPCSLLPVEGEESGEINLFKSAYLNCEDIKLILGYVLDAHRKQNVFDYFIEKEEKIKRINEKYNISFEDICWIYINKLAFYKNYRILFNIWKTLKMMCCILTFYPSDTVNSKKGKLVRRLMNVRAKGATVRKFK
jgi:hypothetical protein